MHRGFPQGKEGPVSLKNTGLYESVFIKLAVKTLYKVC